MIDFQTPSRRVLAFLIAAPFVVVACTGAVADSDSGADTAAAEPTAVAEAPPPETVDDSTAADAETEMSGEPTWLDLEITDAVTGETFTLASLSGQVVAVEPMAIWCTSCKAQQDNVKKVHAELADMGVHYISLGVDPNENKNALAKYAERRGYDWHFAQSNVEFSRALADLFGPQILSVPSTPLIVLDENGDVFTQELGFHGPDKLREIFGEATA